MLLNLYWVLQFPSWKLLISLQYSPCNSFSVNTLIQNCWQQNATHSVLWTFFSNTFLRFFIYCCCRYWSFRCDIIGMIMTMPMITASLIIIVWQCLCSVGAHSAIAVFIKRCLFCLHFIDAAVTMARRTGGRYCCVHSFARQLITMTAMATTTMPTTKMTVWK